jgi:hypothetical protein
LTNPTLFVIMQSEAENKQKGVIKIFTIYNGDFYIAQFSTGLKPVRTKEEAIQFKTYDKASSFMLNMPKSFKNLGYHIEGNAEIVKTTQTQTCPQQNPSEHKKVIVKYDSSYIQGVKNQICQISNFISDLKNKRLEAVEIVEKCEREIFDLEHNAEFYNKNACEGYKMWRKLGEVRRERRRAKDLIVIVDAILEDNSFDGILSQKTLNRISGLENRTYSIRELDDIFPNK